MNKVYAWLGGRSTAFALFAFVAGTVLAFLGKLSVTYVSLIGAIQVLVTARAVSGDFNGNSKAPA